MGAEVPVVDGGDAEFCGRQAGARQERLDLRQQVFVRAAHGGMLMGNYPLVNGLRVRPARANPWRTGIAPPGPPTTIRRLRSPETGGARALRQSLFAFGLGLWCWKGRARARRKSGRGP